MSEQIEPGHDVAGELDEPGEHKRDSAPVLVWKTYGKAIVSGVVVGCVYMTGVVDEGVTVKEWLGLIPFVAAGYGITYAAPSRRTT